MIKSSVCEWVESKREVVKMYYGYQRTHLTSKLDYVKFHSECTQGILNLCILDNKPWQV